MTPEEIEAKRVADEAAAAAAKKIADEAAAKKAVDDAAAKRVAEEAALASKSTAELIALLKSKDDEKAALLKETMQRKDKLKAQDAELAELKALKEKLGGTIGDLSLDDLKKVLEEQKLADEAKLKASGDFDALKQRMADEHKKAIDALNGSYGAKEKESKERLKSAESEIRRLLVSNSFASSKYLSDELMLTAQKAEKLYGEHFKVEEKDGKRHTTAYFDGKPMVDASGNFLPFDEAFKEIINRDPEKDTLIKPKAKSGSGSGNDTKGGKVDLDKQPLRGVAAIKAGLDTAGK